MLAMRDDDLIAALVASMEKHQLIITRHLDKLQDFTLFSDKISGASLLFLFVKSDVSWSSWLGSDGIWDGGHGAGGVCLQPDRKQLKLQVGFQAREDAHQQEGAQSKDG